MGIGTLSEKLGIISVAQPSDPFTNKKSLSEKLGITSNVDPQQDKITLAEKLGIISNVQPKKDKVTLSEKLGLVVINISTKNRTPIDHVFVEQTTRQTTNSPTYVDISGAILTDASLDDNKKYLLVFTALLDNDNGNPNGDLFIRAVHGSTPTEFSGSEMIFDPPSSAETHVTYTWFTVWDAVAGEDVKLQFKRSAGTVGADQITMFAMNLEDDLTENTNWFFRDQSVM